MLNAGLRFCAALITDLIVDRGDRAAVPPCIRYAGDTVILTLPFDPDYDPKATIRIDDSPRLSTTL